MQITRFNRKVSTIIATLLFAVVLGSAAIAASTSGAIVACVHRNSGAIRIVGSSADCRRAETMLSWNQGGTPTEIGIPGSEPGSVLHGRVGRFGCEAGTGVGDIPCVRVFQPDANVLVGVQGTTLSTLTDAAGHYVLGDSTHGLPAGVWMVGISKTLSEGCFVWDQFPNVLTSGNVGEAVEVPTLNVSRANPCEEE